MVTPMHADGSVDLAAAAALAEYLVDQGNDGLVVSGTTGEAPTTSDVEKDMLLRTVIDAVGSRARVVAGVGTNDTAHSIELARAAEKAGAHGLLLVAPYYSRPTQAGLIAHVMAIADATGVPVMLYDIPARSAVEFTTDTLITLAGHPRVIAVKDAKGDLAAATRVLCRVDLAWYSGDDASTLPQLAIGGAGLVGVTTHVASVAYRQLFDAFDRGDLASAIRIHRRLQPTVDAVMTRLPGAVAAKAALHALGRLPSAMVRLPLVPATTSEVADLMPDIEAVSGFTHRS